MKTTAREFVEVYYDPDRCNWDSVINQELSRLGLRHGQVTVICRPFKRVKYWANNETLRMDRADRGR